MTEDRIVPLLQDTREDAAPRYDAFLSYHWPERESVEPIARAMRERGLRVFFDRWYLAPGKPWVVALEEALGSCQVAVIFIGAQGLGTWQQRECDLALDRQVREPEHTVVPVLLPGSDPPLGFLRQLTWIDLRGGLSDPAALDTLVAVVEGRPVETAAAPSDLCPYRGLRPFREEDAEFFFGREAYTERLLEAVQRRRFVAVVGASGSGKSSVVRAGLVPRLRRREGGRVWEIVTMMPGDQPIRALAAALLPFLEPDMAETARLAEIGRLAGLLADGTVSLGHTVERLLARQPGTQRLLLVVDQWEELYTLCADDATRTRFVDMLLKASATGALSVVATLRGDFYGRALEHRALADVLGAEAVVNLGPMLRAELEQAVAGPAERAGLAFEPGLVDRICDEVEREPGKLPLLEFVLAALWEERRGRWLVHAAYERMGELRGAIAERAETLYGELTEAERKLVPSIFLQLIHPGETHIDTRQRARLSELDPAARPVVERFVESRLLITGVDPGTGEETLELALEALIRNWVRLHNWVEDDREFLFWRQRFRFARAEWEKSGDADALLRGLPLVEADHWFASRERQLAEADREFYRASVRARARRRRTRNVQVGFTVGALAIVLILAVGLVRASQVRDQARVAAILNAAASEPDPALATLVLTELRGGWQPPDGMALARRLADVAPEHLPYRVHVVPEGHAVLAAGFTPRGPAVVTESGSAIHLWAALGSDSTVVLSDGPDAVAFATFSADGALLATASSDGTVRLWETAGGRPAGVLGGGASTRGADVLEVAIAPDGSRVAAAHDDGSVRVWERAGGREAYLLRDPRVTQVLGLSFSADGARLAVLHAGGVHVIGPGGAVVFQHAATDVAGAALLADGREMITTHAGESASVLRWDLERPGVAPVAVGRHPGANRAVAAADGSLIVTVSSHGSARTWSSDPARRRTLATPEGVLSAAFGADGAAVLLFGGSEVWIWRLDVPPEPAQFWGHTNIVHSAVFEAGGTRILTAAEDSTLRLWGADGGGPLRVYEANEMFYHAEFSRGGDRIAAAGRDGGVYLCDAELRECTVLRRLDGAARRVEFSRDGAWLAVATDEVSDSNVRVISTGAESTIVLGRHEGRVRSSRFSPDGAAVVTTSDDGSWVIWSLRDDRRQIRVEGPRAHRGAVRDARFNADGTRVVTASRDSTVRVWDARTGRPLGRPMQHGFGVEIAVFTPDGAHVVAGTQDGRVVVWPSDGEGRGRTLGRMRREVTDLHFDRGGGRVAAASADSTVRIWSLDGRGQPEVLFLGSSVSSVRFSPDDRHILTADQGERIVGLDGEVASTPETGGRVRLWRTVWQDLLEHLRTTTRLCLTPQERVRFFNEPEPDAVRRSRECSSEVSHSRGRP